MSKYDHVEVTMNSQNKQLYLKIENFGTGLFPMGRETNVAIVGSKFEKIPRDIVGNICDFINSQIITDEYSSQGQYLADRIYRGKTVRQTLEESNLISRAVDVCHSGIDDSVVVEYLENNIPSFGHLIGVSMYGNTMKAIVHSDVSMRDISLEMIDIKIDKKSLMEVEDRVRLMESEQTIRRVASTPSSY